MTARIALPPPNSETIVEVSNFDPISLNPAEAGQVLQFVTSNTNTLELKIKNQIVCASFLV